MIRVTGLSKIYKTARGELRLFDKLDLEVERGEMVAILGRSGAGKSTLLHILGALDSATEGSVECAGVNVTALTTKAGSEFRNRQVGYVWQFHYLLPEFTAAENVALPLMARGDSRAASLAEANHWLNEVGLSDRAEHRPGELSGGEQQRVALARALVTRPAILLADEPTGDLDETTSNLIFDLIERLHREHQLTSILVTHNEELGRRCTRSMRLESGRLRQV